MGPSREIGPHAVRNPRDSDNLFCHLGICFKFPPRTFQLQGPLPSQSLQHQVLLIPVPFNILPFSPSLLTPSFAKSLLAELGKGVKGFKLSGKDQWEPCQLIRLGYLPSIIFELVTTDNNANWYLKKREVAWNVIDYCPLNRPDFPSITHLFQLSFV